MELIEEEQKRFEVWIAKRLGLTEREISGARRYGKYAVYQHIQFAWEAWQAEKISWINCSDKLPEHQVDVLVIDRNDGHEITIGCREINDVFRLQDGTRITGIKWMPLPEEPE